MDVERDLRALRHELRGAINTLALCTYLAEAHPGGDDAERLAALALIDGACDRVADLADRLVKSATTA
jgi:hypothetical protein